MNNQPLINTNSFDYQTISRTFADNVILSPGLINLWKYNKEWIDFSLKPYELTHEMEIEIRNDIYKFLLGLSVTILLTIQRSKLLDMFQVLLTQNHERDKEEEEKYNPSEEYWLRMSCKWCNVDKANIFT